MIGFGMIWVRIGFGLDRVGLHFVWFIFVRCGLGSITKLVLIVIGLIGMGINLALGLI